MTATPPPPPSPFPVKTVAGIVVGTLLLLTILHRFGVESTTEMGQSTIALLVSGAAWLSHRKSSRIEILVNGRAHDAARMIEEQTNQLATQAEQIAALEERLAELAEHVLVPAKPEAP